MFLINELVLNFTGVARGHWMQEFAKKAKKNPADLRGF
jgi:hypothetical protein